MNKFNYFENKNKHYFHILTQSLLPAALSFSIGFLLLSIVLMWSYETKECYDLYSVNKMQLHTSFFFILIFSSSWFSCVLNESICGHHNFFVKKGLMLGFFFFLITEFMLFFSFFWAYFYLCLNPSFLIGNVWPPQKTTELDVWKLPFFNTVLLLTSGYAATVAHSFLLNQTYNFSKTNRKTFLTLLTGAVCFGVAFVFSQVCEYKYAILNTWSNNSFWSCFFLLTGFHGIHVFIGILLLVLNLTKATIANFFEKRYFYIWTIIQYFYRIFIVGGEIKQWQTKQICRNYWSYFSRKNKTYAMLLENFHLFDAKRIQELLNYDYAMFVYLCRERRFWFMLSKEFAFFYYPYFAEVRIKSHVDGWPILHWVGVALLKAGYNPKNYKQLQVFRIPRPFWDEKAFIEDRWNKLIIFLNEKLNFNSDQHLSYETSLFYWHFVDIVWIFLFIFIYIWGF